jgi:hypothetical protein
MSKYKEGIPLFVIVVDIENRLNYLERKVSQLATKKNIVKTKKTKMPKVDKKKGKK